MSDNKKFSIKYSDVSKDYDLSEMQFTFDFIYLVLKRNYSIEGALKGVSNEYDLSEVYLKDYLIENKYLINKKNMTEFSNQLKRYNTKSLKKILKKYGLKTSGKRERIEKRIFENNLLADNFYLSSKSKIFYKNKKRRINIFNEYLYDHYYFNEFNEFYINNYRKKEDKIPVEFIAQHINKSIEDKNHENYISNTQIMADCFFKKENYHKMLDYVLKKYCMNLNPIWKIPELNKHIGLYMDTYEDLIFLKNELSKNTIISNYYLIWDSFNFDRTILTKFDGYRYLKDILNYKNYNKINQDLNNKFYCNKNLKIKKVIQKTLFDF